MVLKIPSDDSYDQSSFNYNLSRFAKKNGIDISSTVGEGNAFELFVATVLMLNGYKIDRIVGGSGDQGGDIIAHKGSNRTKTESVPFTFGMVSETKRTSKLVKYCIQCKFHFSGNEGNRAIKDANLGKTKYKCNEGVAVSSTSFTPGGYEAAELMKISTINGSQLTYLIAKASKKQDPWTYKWTSDDLRKVGFN